MSYHRKQQEKKIYKRKLRDMGGATYGVGGYYYDEDKDRIVRYNHNRKKDLRAIVKNSNRKVRYNEEISKEGRHYKKSGRDALWNYL